MKKLKRIKLLILAIVLIAATLTACDTSESEEVAATTAPATTTQANEEVPVEEEEADIVKDDAGNIIKVNFPLEESISVSIMGFPGYENQDNNNSPALLWAEEETNIDFEYIPLEDRESAMLMMTSGEYADLYVSSVLSSDDIVGYGAAGVFLDGNDYVSEELTPNLNNLFETRPASKGVCSAPDGGLYSLPRMDEYEGNFLEFWFVASTDALEAVDMDTPTSMDEMYEFLKACKENDANGNGIDDEIGMGFGGTNMRSFVVALSIWGLPTKPGNYENLSYVKDGKVTFAMNTENYQAAIRYFNKLYSEGLLDQESFTQDEAALDNKIYNDEPVIFASLMNKTTPEGFEVIAPPEGTEGYEPVWYIHPGYYGVKDRCCVSNKSDTPEIIYAYIDSFYYEFNNAMKYRYGDIFHVNDDDTFYFDSYDSTEYETANAWYGANGGAYAPWCYLEEDVARCVNENVEDNLLINASRVYAYDFGYSAVANTEIWPRPYTNPDTVDEMAAIKADIFALCNEMYARWITSPAGTMEAEWDQYIKDLENMGLDRMLELLQIDYDNFMAGQDWE